MPNTTTKTLAILLLFTPTITADTTISNLWDYFLPTTQPANTTIKNASWDKLAGGKVVVLLPYTTYAESLSDVGTVPDPAIPAYHPTTASLAQLVAENHKILSILPSNV